MSVYQYVCRPMRARCVALRDAQRHARTPVHPLVHRPFGAVCKARWRSFHACVQRPVRAEVVAVGLPQWSLCSPVIYRCSNSALHSMWHRGLCVHRASLSVHQWVHVLPIARTGCCTTCYTVLFTSPSGSCTLCIALFRGRFKHC